jgi:hypothetical protein
LDEYKEFFGIVSEFETHPCASERLEKIKNSYSKNEQRNKFEMAHDFVGFSLFLLNEYNKLNVINEIKNLSKHEGVK